MRDMMSSKNVRHEGQDVAGRLRELRIAIFGDRGKRKFAMALGVPPQTYQGYESGRQPPADFFREVVRKCGCTLEWLIMGRGDMWPSNVRYRGTVDGSIMSLVILESGEGLLDVADHSRAEASHADQTDATFSITCKRAITAGGGAFTLSDEGALTLAVPQCMVPKPELISGIVYTLDGLRPTVIEPAILVITADTEACHPLTAESADPDYYRIALARVKAEGERKRRLLFAGTLSEADGTHIITPLNYRYSPKIVRPQDIIGRLSMALLDLSGSIKEDGKGD